MKEEIKKIIDPWRGRDPLYITDADFDELQNEIQELIERKEREAFNKARATAEFGEFTYQTFEDYKAKS